jgi:hypothetical protein
MALFKGFVHLEKKMKNFPAWVIGEKLMRLTGLEIPQKAFQYRFFSRWYWAPIMGHHGRKWGFQ